MRSLPPSLHAATRPRTQLGKRLANDSRLGWCQVLHSPSLQSHAGQPPATRCALQSFANLLRALPKPVVYARWANSLEAENLHRLLLVHPSLEATLDPLVADGLLASDGGEEGVQDRAVLRHRTEPDSRGSAGSE